MKALNSFSLLWMLLMLAVLPANGQTFPFNTWTAGSFTYNRTVAGNTMSVVYSESGNFRNNTTAFNTECFGVQVSSPRVPFFYNAQTMYVADYSTWACYCGSGAANSGVVLAANWSNNNYNWEQLDISFSTPVCGPVTFNIWDINQNFFNNASSTYFTDALDISATDASGADVPAGSINIGACGSNTVTTAGNIKTVRGVLNGCGCRSTSVSINPGGTVKSIRIRYWNAGSTYSSDPQSQYVVITQIVASPPPTASINAAPLTCGSTSTTLTAVTNASNPTYQWTGPAGSTVSNPNGQSTSVSGAGTYTLTINPGGCSATATYTLTPFGTPPDLTVSPNQTANCSTPVISASSTTPGVTFSWSGPGIVSGGNTPNPVVNVSGTYTVTVTNPTNGCVNTAQVQVVVDKTPPNVDAGPDRSLDCPPVPIALNGSSSTTGVGYSWTGPGIVSGVNSATPTINAPGTYVLTVTNPNNGCTATDNTLVSGTTPQTPVFTAIPPFCEGLPAPVLPTTSNNGITGSWSPAVVSNTVSGNYTFTPDAGQCASPITINIAVFQEPDTSSIFHD